MAIESLYKTNFSTFLRESGSVLEEIDAHDVLLERRDGEDLLLVRADREAEMRESVGVFSRIFAAIPEAAVLDARKNLRKELPWLVFLPEEDQTQFLHEFLETAAGCSELDSYTPLVRCLREWMNTARVHADPELLAAIHAPHDTDEAVPRPE